MIENASSHKWTKKNIPVHLGVEKLMQVYKDRPNFADQDAQDDAKNRLMQVEFIFPLSLNWI